MQECVVQCEGMQELFIQRENVFINAKFVQSNVKRCYPMQDMCYTTQQT